MTKDELEKENKELLLLVELLDAAIQERNRVIDEQYAKIRLREDEIIQLHSKLEGGRNA